MKVGSLFTGYGGLDMAVGGEMAWYSEIEPAACQILTQHHPDVPNLGDIMEMDWSQVEPVDIITGGYPCQPFSMAGSRKGKDDDRHLWPYVRDAVYALRPRYAILENVSGHLTLGLADVLADLAQIGFNAEWGTYRASSVGAPHRRERVFIVAYPNSYGYGEQLHARGMGSVEVEAATSTQKRERSRGESDTGGTIFPAYPNSTDGEPQDTGVRSGTTGHVNWGKYATAITRWERLTRPAPNPTYQRAGKQRLNPAFVEWMMGLDAGHVTGHGLSSVKELKMLGNGVVPQQARAAIQELLGRI